LKGKGKEIELKQKEWQKSECGKGCVYDQSLMLFVTYYHLGLNEVSIWYKRNAMNCILKYYHRLSGN